MRSAEEEAARQKIVTVSRGEMLCHGMRDAVVGNTVVPLIIYMPAVQINRKTQQSEINT